MNELNEIDIKKIEEISDIMKHLTCDTIIKVNAIIENELKLVVEKYNIDPKNLIFVATLNNNIDTKTYDIAIKINKFSIEQKLIFRG